MSLDWPVSLFGRSESSRPWLPSDVVLFQLLNILAGDRVLFMHNRRYSNVLQGGTGAAPSFPRVYVVLLGILRALSDLSSPDRGTES